MELGTPYVVQRGVFTQRRNLFRPTRHCNRRYCVTASTAPFKVICFLHFTQFVWPYYETTSVDLQEQTQSSNLWVDHVAQ